MCDSVCVYCVNVMSLCVMVCCGAWQKLREEERELVLNQ